MMCNQYIISPCGCCWPRLQRHLRRLRLLGCCCIDLIEESVVEAAGILGTPAPLRLAYFELLDRSISVLGYMVGLRVLLLRPT